MKKNEIIKIYGTDYREMTVKLLEASGLAALIEEKGLRKDALIGIKPNLVTCSPAEYGGTTHPEIVSGIIEYLESFGYGNLLIIEGSWVGDRTGEAFLYCGYEELSERYGVALFDTQKDTFFEADCAGLTLSVCSKVKDMDFLINVPVLKGHCQTKMTCALKNMKGLIPNSEKRRFHRMGLHKPIAHLNAYIRQDFIVVDNICGDPYFEEGGSPLIKNCIFTSLDPVLADAYACRELGVSKEEVPYVMMSEQLDIGSTKEPYVRVIGESRGADESGEQRKLLDVSYAVNDSDTCSACYACLTGALTRLSEEGLLADLPVKIGIGQGMRGRTGLFGVGNCTKDFLVNIPGCPPAEEDIYLGLKEYIEKRK